MSVLVKSLSADVSGIASNVTAIKAKTDNLPSDPADESLLEAELDRKFPFMDFWSAPADKITVTNSAADLTFPSITVSGLPAGLTIQKIVLILTVRALFDTSGSDNYINAASKTLRVKKSTGGWLADSIVGITFDQNSLYTIASTKEPGAVLIGTADVKSIVDGNATYNVASEQTNNSDAIVALGNNLELYDVQVGLRVYFS